MTQLLQSTVDGFKIAVGSWIVNLAALLAMLIAIRAPPNYENEDLDRDAKWTFTMLIFMHAITCAVKVHALYIGDYWWDKQTVMMLYVVGMQIWLCRGWLYNLDEDAVPLTPSQRKWEIWLYLEYMLVYSNIMGGIVYILICRIAPMAIEVHSEHLSRDGMGDFLDANTMIVDLFNAIISPAIVGFQIMIKSNGLATAENAMTGWIFGLLVIQGVLLIFGLQMKRVGANWSPKWNTLMPKITAWCAWISLVVFPAIIGTSAAIGALALHQSVPFLALNIFSQLVLSGWYWTRFKASLEAHFAKIEELREAIELLYARAEFHGLIERHHLPGAQLQADHDQYQRMSITWRPELEPQLDSQEDYDKICKPVPTETE